jgi:hypothetical protein
VKAPAGIACAAATALIVLPLAGCGGDGGSGTGGGSTAARGLPPGHAPVLVIEEWVKTLSRGDVSGAADLFALPSVVENGTPPRSLRTRADALLFNRSLPCGGRLVRARPDGRYIAATFRLTERPGGDCGSGVGELARTAFLIRGDKIVEWHRLPDPPGGTGPSGPIV